MLAGCDRLQMALSELTRLCLRAFPRRVGETILEAFTGESETDVTYGEAVARSLKNTCESCPLGISGRGTGRWVGGIRCAYPAGVRWVRCSCRA